MESAPFVGWGIDISGHATNVRMNSIPFDGTGERIERDGSWRVYEFSVQLDAIQFWDRFDGRWLRGEEFIYPDRPKGLPQLREPVEMNL